MTRKDVISLLKANANERGIAAWKRMDPSHGAWTSYGIGLTVLKKLAKQIGRDHNLALQLWEEKNCECKVMSTLIEDHSEVTEEQVERQVSEVGYWLMAHSYCQSLMSGVPFRRAKCEEWIKSRDHVRRRCGYLVLAGLAGSDKSLPESYFEPYLVTIEKDLQSEENFVRDAMNNALYAIGCRSRALHKRALAIAKKIGRVEVDYGDNSCQAVDVVKHLSSDRVKAKVARV